MRPVYVSTSTSGNIVIPLDYHRTPFNVGIGIIPVSAAPAINIQHTFDPVGSNAEQAAAVWFNTTALTSVSVTTAGQHTYPITAMRVNQLEPGNARVVIIQAGLVC